MLTYFFSLSMWSEKHFYLVIMFARFLLYRDRGQYLLRIAVNASRALVISSRELSKRSYIRPMYPFPSNVHAHCECESSFIHQLEEKCGNTKLTWKNWRVHVTREPALKGCYLWNFSLSIHAVFLLLPRCDASSLYLYLFKTVGLRMIYTTAQIPKISWFRLPEPREPV